MVRRSVLLVRASGVLASRHLSMTRVVQGRRKSVQEEVTVAEEAPGSSVGSVAKLESELSVGRRETNKTKKKVLAIADESVGSLADLEQELPVGRGESKKTKKTKKKSQAEALEGGQGRVKDRALNSADSETQSTHVYIDLIKSLLVSGEVPEATEILEKMPVQGWKLPTYVCNMVILPWLEQGGAVGLRQARKILKLMEMHRVSPNPRTVAMALIVAVARLETELLHSMLRTVEAFAYDPIELGHLFELHGGVKRSRATHAQAFVVKARSDSESFEQIYMHAMQVSLAKDSSAGIPSLSAVSTSPPPLAEELSLNPLYREQLSLETRANEDAVQKYRNAMKEVINLGRGANMAPAQDILLLWYEPLVRAISEEHRRIGTKDSARDRSVYGPKLLSVDAERLAVITIHEVLGLLMANPAGVKFVTLAQGIGSAVQAEYNFAKARQEGNQLVSYLRTTGELLTVNTVNKVARFSQNAEGPDTAWGPKLLVKVGGVLIELLLNVARVPPNLSFLELARFKREHGSLSKVTAQEDWPLAFRHGYRYAGRKKFGTIYCLPEVLETIENGHKLRETVNARYLPMLVQPRDWTSAHSGGYLAYKTWVMRTKGSELQRQSLIEADLGSVFKALDVLGSAAWSINRFVQESIQQAWEGGGGELDLPSRADLEIPVPPSDFADDPKERKRFLAHQRKVIQQQRDLHGLRCALKYQLAVATEFQDRVFYFPHNLDFRGRSYPIPPHLNQMGSDLCRGLLNFATAKPLGASGLRWLKIHLANLYGNDKITHEERLAFIDRSMDDVLLSAKDPLGAGTWWKDSDSPWQALGVCKALEEALSYPGGAELYPCNIPVHQDGSCNGLQHYAALGGDVWGAEQVNLLPRETPQDVYGGVAKLVAKRVAEDAANGQRLGLLLDGKIDRKIVKQTVMTSVYGVTFVGARKQIFNAMKSRIQDISEEDIFQSSGYLTRHTFSALEEMFIGARKIMHWLGSCARKIAKTGKPVTWTTPLGLPVVQPYRRAGRSAVVTLVQTVILEDQNDKLPVNVARQKSAFAPNFVHSLDSTHMMLTALKCAQDKEDITFASVHDSFWTHACDVDTMNSHLRDSFVELHSEPLLQQLADHFRRIHPEIEFDPVPKKGDLDLTEVRNSPYFFH